MTVCICELSDDDCPKHDGDPWADWLDTGGEGGGGE